MFTRVGLRVPWSTVGVGGQLVAQLVGFRVEPRPSGLVASTFTTEPYSRSVALKLLVLSQHRWVHSVLGAAFFLCAHTRGQSRPQSITVC